MFFCGISFIQACYYPPVQLPVRKIVAVIVLFALIWVGSEVGFILWLRPVYRHGTHWPALIFGIIASVLLALGLLPPYFELAKRQGRVVGINFVFLFVDSLGAWLSIISVILGNMDVMGIVLYCVVAALELGIFASHFLWCCRFKWFHKQDDQTNLEVETATEAVEIKSNPEKNSLDYSSRALQESKTNQSV